MARVRSPVRSILAGAAVVLPFVLIALVGWQVLLTVIGISDWLVPLASWVGVSGLAGRFLAAGLGLTVVVVVLLVIGIVVRNRIGELAIGMLDRLVERVPLLGPIYHGLRQARELVLARDSDRFEDVTLVELTGGVTVLGFVVGGANPAVQTATTDDRVAVYVPLAPNPTVGGHMLFVSPDRLVSIDMSIPAALAAIVTLGAGPDSLDESPLAGLYHDRPPESNT